ncbi:unnamed protein product, partial [Hymenolepis diminuta]
SFQFGSLEENQFRCPIFIHVLRSPRHAEIRLRLMSLLDERTDVKKSRRRAEAITPKVPIMRRASLSSRLPYRRRCCHKYLDNGQRAGFHLEPSTISSRRQNPNNNKRALTQLGQSYD